MTKICGRPVVLSQSESVPKVEAEGVESRLMVGGMNGMNVSGRAMGGEAANRSTWGNNLEMCCAGLL